MTSRFLLPLGGPPEKLRLESFIKNGTMMVLLDGCDTSLVDPGGSFMCVADGGMLHELREILANPEVNRTKL